VNTSCGICHFLRVVLLGSAGAIAGAWLAPYLGMDPHQRIMPATVGALVALGLGVLILRLRG
jgi:uncharacterized membrane protein YeaQ/YmgE (transglycosylase-associated protein family)